MSSPEKGFLSHIKPKRVSLVKYPAIEREFLLLKSKDREMDELLQIVSETEAAGESELVEALKSRGYDEKAIKAVTTAARIFSAYADELDAESFGAVAKSLGFNAPETTETEETEIDKSKLAKLDPETRREVERVMKASEKDRERLEKLEKAIAERDDRERLEVFKSKAADVELPDVDSDKIAEGLKALADAAGDDVANELADGLVKASNAYKTSDLFKEIGSGADDDAGEDTYGKLEKAAKEIMKSDKSVRFADALDRAMEENPELAQKYLDEQRRV